MGTRSKQRLKLELRASGRYDDGARDDHRHDPMALGAGEGGEQNAPLGRAVIGGLGFATIATLIFVPAVFALLHSSDKKTEAVDESHEQHSTAGA